MIERSLPHGHVAAVLGVLRDLDLERLIGRERCRERDLVVAMICQRLIGPGSKLSATRRFAQTHARRRARRWATVSRPSCWRAMDWLLERQQRIERTLARRHLAGGGVRALRPVLELCRGALLPAGDARLLARRQARHAAGQLRADRARPRAARSRSACTRATPRTSRPLPGAVAGGARALRDRRRGRASATAG